MDAQFDLSTLNKDLGRLEAVGEQIIKVADKLTDKVDRVIEAQNKADQRITVLEGCQEHNDNVSTRKLFWWGVSIAALTTVAAAFLGAWLTYIFSK